MNKNYFISMLILGLINLLFFANLAEAKSVPPFRIDFFIFDNMAIDKPVNLTVDITPTSDRSNFSIMILLSEGIELVKGDLTKKVEGPVARGEKIQLNTTIVVKEGYWEIKAIVGKDLNETWYEHAGYLRINMSVNGTTVSRLPLQLKLTKSEELDSRKSTKIFTSPDFGQNVTQQQSNITSAAATATIFSEDFEGAFCNGCNGWTVNDGNSSNGYDYWDDTNYKAHAGSWSSWVADVGSQEGTPNSQLHQYDDNMDAYMRRTIDLTGYASASLEFWHLMPSVEGGQYDYGQLKVNGVEVKRYKDTITSWTKETIDLSSYAGKTITIEWNFHSDASVRREGWYVDDIKVVGTKLSEITVKGYLYYWDDNTASYQPIRYAKVELWDSDVFFDDLLVTNSTDSTGYFSIGPVSNSDDEGGTQDIYVVVKAETSAVKVIDSSNKIWWHKTNPPVNNVPNGIYNMGNWTVADSDDGVYNIYNVIIQGYQYVDNRPNTPTPSQVTVKWYPGNTDGTHYHQGGEIHILGSNDPSKWSPDEWDNGVILHEYGHYLGYIYDIDNSLGGDHSWSGIYNNELAWSEGWGHYFSSAVRDSNSYRDTWNGGWVEINVETGIARKVESGRETARWDGNSNGPASEASVAGVLWDIYDLTDDDQNRDSIGDTLYTGSNNIWDVIFKYVTEGHGVYHINEFWNGWFARGHNELEKMNAIFWEHGIDKNNAPTVTSLDQTPTSLYRTQTFKAYAHYSDTETPEGSLTSTIQYRRPANDAWNDCTEIWDSGNHRWYCDITTTTNDNQLGTWDFVTRVDDGMEVSDWTQDPNTVTVLNNNPTVAGLDKSTSSLYRTQSFTIYMHGSDAEDAESSLTPRIQYQLPANTGWNDCAESWDSPNHRWYCTVITTTADSQLGTWDIRGMFTDSDAGESSWTMQNDVITVSNNQPSLFGIPDKNTNEDTTPPDNWIDLHNYASDLEDGDSSMTYTIISETNSPLIDCSIISNRYVDCGAPALHQNGYSDVTVRVSDTDGGINTDTFRVTVNPVNDPPILSGIPDKSTNMNVIPPDNFIDMYIYASDAEDTDDQLTFSINSQSNPSLISCAIVSDRYVDCGAPALNQYGYSDITVKVTDTGSLTATDTFRMTVNQVIPQKKNPGELCSSNSECTTNYCEGSLNNAKRCCSSQPTADGWYGGGDAGCSILDDPASQYRDYYCTSTGSATYEATDTKDCDSLDTSMCSANVVEQRDYYVQANSNTCTYCSQTTDPDTSSSACLTCGKKWSIGGEVAATTCCGDDPNEYSKIYEYCSGNSCSGITNRFTCCSSSGSCVYEGVCYQHGYTGDINQDNKNERCDNGAWREIISNYTIPRGKLGLGQRVIKGSSQNFNIETTVSRMPVGRNTSSNYIIDMGYSHYFG